MRNYDKFELIHDLLQKWLSEDISDVELIILNNWADASAKNKELMENLKNDRWLAIRLWELEQTDTKGMREKLQALLGKD